MKFSCNCRNETDFKTMLDEVHNEEWGTNFEVGARLLFTPDGLDKTIMVEYQITTRDCKEMLENKDEPDWLTAYEVDDENDTDVTYEIFTDTIKDIKLVGLENSMLDFAKNVYKRFYN